MTIIRCPSHAREHGRFLLLSGLIILAVSAGLLTWSKHLGQWQVQGAVVAVLGLPLGYKSLISAMNYFQGHRGERLIEEVLLELDDRYLLVRNWVPAGSKQGDIDMVLIGPCGVVVLEAKNLTGVVQCDRDRWSIQRANGSWRPIKNYSRQLTRNSRLASRCFGMSTTGILVLNEQVSLDLRSPTVRVLRRRELLAFIKALPNWNIDARGLWERVQAKDLIVQRSVDV